MKKKFFNKLTIIDILIIICIICAICFAVFHMTQDSDNGTAVSFDASTANKINENYLNLYKDGNIIKSKVVGTNATSGEDITINGTVLWVDEDNGAKVKILIENNGEKYLVGLYKDVPNADIYIKQITLETTGEKYQNLKEITVAPKNISDLNELVSGIKNKNYEISTSIGISKIDSITYQELINKLQENKKEAITLSTKFQDTLEINKADYQTISIGNSILGQINGQTGEITIRIYNCSDNDIKVIKSNYNVLNIRDIT